MDNKNNSSHYLIYGLKILALGIIYYSAARFGLSINAVSGFAALVWPPTGIAIAALLLFGTELWSAIFLAAFFVNYFTGASMPIAIGIGAGNTLEALAAVYLLKYFGFHSSFDRVKDVLLLGGLAAVLSTLISSTIGALSLYFGGIVTSATLRDTWAAWWLGDALGAMIVAPFIIVWMSSPLPKSITAMRFLESMILILAISLIALISFGNPYLFEGNYYFVYLLFPPLTWACLRFSRRYVLTLIIALCAFAIWSTIYGYGPFAAETITKGLLQLQIFIAVFAITKMILSATDAERRKAEGTQKETLQYLEEKVKERTEQLNDNIIKLKETQHELIHAEKLAALGRFSSGIAHEIRNPLANISALAQIIKRSEVNERSKKHLEHILINTNIANKIIKDLLNYASPDDIELTPGKIGKILDRICTLDEPRCKTKKVNLIKNINGDFPLIELNQNKIENAFMNFISNAIDAMPNGGTLKVTAFTDNEHSEINISFSDTGIGIAKESIDKIFEPFYTTKTEGTGLGMSMAYETIRSLGGHINIVSEVNSGTEIQIKIPYFKNKSIQNYLPEQITED